MSTFRIYEPGPPEDPGPHKAEAPARGPAFEWACVALTAYMAGLTFDYGWNTERPAWARVSALLLACLFALCSTEYALRLLGWKK